MKRGRVILILAAVLALGGLAVYLAQPGEPTYQGRKLSSWVQDAMKGGRESPAALDAVRKIGTNAFPIYWKWMGAQNNPVKLKINQLLDRQHFIQFRFNEDAMDRITSGYDGIVLLGTAAVPCLVEIIHNRSTKAGNRRAAMDILSDIDGGRGIGLPEYVEMLKCPERELRVGAAVILWKHYPKEAEKAGVYDLFPDWRHGGAKTNAVGQSK
jgi:hypothetical protein